MIELRLRNRQRTRLVDLRHLRQITRACLCHLEVPATVELGVHLVAAPEITRLNETYLRHAGPTDVITFNLAAAPPRERLHGEIFICVDEAARQARRYRTSWQAELVRYLVHGVLHLQDYDDRYPAQRRRMKRAEDRVLRRLAGQFPIARLARSGRPRRRRATHAHAARWRPRVQSGI